MATEIAVPTLALAKLKIELPPKVTSSPVSTPDKTAVPEVVAEVIPS